MAARKKPPVLPTEADVPKDIAAERAVLGSILVDGRAAYLKAAAVLTPEDFLDPRHRAIFAAMARLAGSGATIDPVTVSAALEDESRD